MADIWQLRLGLWNKQRNVDLESRGTLSKIEEEWELPDHFVGMSHGQQNKRQRWEASIQGLVVWQGFRSTLVLVLKGYHEILQGLLGSILSDLSHWEPWTFYHCQNNWFPTLLAFILTHIPCCQLSSLMEPDIQVNGWLTWPSNWFWT